MKATSKGAWGCFITALNIATNSFDNSFELKKEDVPKFAGKVDAKFKHTAYSEEQMKTLLESVKDNKKFYSLFCFLFETKSRFQDAFGV